VARTFASASSACSLDRLTGTNARPQSLSQMRLRCGTLISACMAGVRVLEASLCLRLCTSLRGSDRSTAELRVCTQSCRHNSPCRDVRGLLHCSSLMRSQMATPSHGLANLRRLLHKRFSRSGWLQTDSPAAVVGHQWDSRKAPVPIGAKGGEWPKWIRRGGHGCSHAPNTDDYC